MLSLRNVTFGFGGDLLLKDLTVEIEKGHRYGLVGRNGCGKSTLFKLISGFFLPDSGEIVFGRSSRCAILQQDIPEFQGTVFDFVDEQMKTARMEEWARHSAVERILEELDLLSHVSFENLSTGRKRQLLFQSLYSCQPDILLLDEPTNHLDMPAIQRMENKLLSYQGALLFITHDRWFLRKISNSILDLDRGRLSRWNCDYETYLQRKQEWLDAEEKNNAIFDKKLAQEEVWIRQGIKARRTRNEGRVRALQQLRQERKSRRERTGSVEMSLSSGTRSGDKVVEAKDVVLSYGESPVINKFSTIIHRGDRVGIIGPNGSGKSSLIRLLLEEAKPQSGTVKHGTNLQIAYFDQTRESLNPETRVQDCIVDGRDTVPLAGKEKHVVSYLEDFLFSREQVRGTVKALSGGEKNRLLLARLFARPFNFLVMDEPTNDLDLETLDLLEEKLGDFDGTLLLVSHDRDFLDRVVTDVMVLDGSGTVQSFAGGYSDYWCNVENKNKKGSVDLSAGKEKNTWQKNRREKMSNRESKELESLPEDIAALEEEQEKYTKDLANPDLYTLRIEEVDTIKKRVAELEVELKGKYLRWEVLEQKKEAILSSDNP